MLETSTFQLLDLYFLSNSSLGIKILANLTPLRRLLFFLVWFLSIVNTLNRDSSTSLFSLDLVMSISSPSLTWGQNKTWCIQCLSEIFIIFIHNVHAQQSHDQLFLQDIYLQGHDQSNFPSLPLTNHVLTQGHHAPVVQILDSTTQWINPFPLGKYNKNLLSYPVDHDLSNG